eukprot:5330002-Amphidinium_carterae.1
MARHIVECEQKRKSFDRLEEGWCHFSSCGATQERKLLHGIVSGWGGASSLEGHHPPGTWLEQATTGYTGDTPNELSMSMNL